MPLTKILTDGSETGESSAIKINRAFDEIDLHKVVGNAHTPTNSYKTGDITSHSGYAYIAKHAVPPKAFSVTDWELIGTGVQMDEMGGLAWKSTTTYLSGVVATYGAFIYMAIKDTTGMRPDISPSDWQIPVTDCGNF